MLFCRIALYCPMLDCETWHLNRAIVLADNTNSFEFWKNPFVIAASPWVDPHPLVSISSTLEVYLIYCPEILNVNVLCNAFIYFYDGLRMYAYKLGGLENTKKIRKECYVITWLVIKSGFTYQDELATGKYLYAGDDCIHLYNLLTFSIVSYVMTTQPNY